VISGVEYITNLVYVLEMDSK